MAGSSIVELIRKMWVGSEGSQPVREVCLAPEARPIDLPDEIGSFRCAS
jgi:hypothetical protein